MSATRTHFHPGTSGSDPKADAKLHAPVATEKGTKAFPTLAITATAPTLAPTATMPARLRSSTATDPQAAPWADLRPPLRNRPGAAHTAADRAAARPVAATGAAPSGCPHPRRVAKTSVLSLACLGVAFLPAMVGAQGAFSSIAEPQTSVRDILTGPQNRPRADTYYLLGLAAARKNNHAEALRQIAIGLRLEPNHLRLLGLRAAVWARQGRTSEAIAEFRRLVRLYPGDEYAAQSLRDLEKPLKPRFAPVTSSLPAPPPKRDSPVAPVDTARPASPTRMLEASYFERMKQKQRCCFQMTAIKRAQEARAAAHPAKKDAFDLQALIEGGKLSAKPVCPEGGEYSWAGGPTCSKHGDLATVESEVTTVFADFNRGMQNKIGRNFTAALQAFDQVCALYPQWSEAHYQRGDTLFRLGEDKAAIEAIRRSLQCDPGNLDAKLLLANLLFKVGHKEAALDLLDGVATGQAGSVYGLAARSVAKAIRSGRNYYQVFPPN